MEKGICAEPRCNKQSDFVVTYKIVKDMGGKQQESNSVVGCYCEKHAYQKQDNIDRLDIRLISIDDLNNK